jgi:hypothetical protein
VGKVANDGKHRRALVADQPSAIIGASVVRCHNSAMPHVPDWFRRHGLVAGPSMVVIGLIAAWLFWPAQTTNPLFTKGQYIRIQLGMTRAEVESVMEMEPGYYGESNSQYEGPIYEETEGDMGAAYEALEAAGETPDGPEQLNWQGDNGSVIVWLINDRVCQKMYTAPESKIHRRFMNAMDSLLGAPGQRPVQEIPKPSARPANAAPAD